MRREPEIEPLCWWHVVLGGIAVVFGTFAFLWAIAFFSWALEGLPA